MNWLGNFTLLTKPSPGAAGLKTHSPTGPGEPPAMGDVVGTQLKGPTAKPFKQLHKKQIFSV